jgi:hypothetical protein
VVGIAFKTAEMHKASVLMLAEKAYNEGRLSYNARLAWERYLKTCEKEHQAYDNFCLSFLDHMAELKKRH